ncbi:hypothetical protein [Mesobacillus subterraneus]|uniref:Uncharacterized protein n=1 Tax=Mesobacillus subterraneus TaxID=285983 RepID=A0A427TR92_9BACI|nr:hypothetical protein [Mesobacillus subterraneus]RSD26806.1 hypothetical protein EJA10_13190 [Mesobacillus subterraneus]
MSIVFLLLLIILLALSFGGFSNKIFGTRIMSGSGITKVFAGYFIILLGAGILSLMISVDETFKGDFLTDKEIEENDRLNSDIYPTIESGKIDEAEGLTKKESWEFPLKGRLLDVKIMNQHAQIFIEKVDSLEENVEVTHYSTYSYMDNIDITDRFPSPDIQLDGTILKIFPPDHVTIKLVKFSKAFPFTQFYEYGEQISNGYGMMQGMDFIYIRVPADIELSGDGYVIN